MVAIASHPFTANEQRVLQVVLLAAFQWDEPQPVRIGEVVRITRLGRGPVHSALRGLKAQLVVSPVAGEDGLLGVNAPAAWRPRAPRRCGFARAWERTHDENAAGDSSLFLNRQYGVSAAARTHDEYGRRSHDGNRPRPSREAARVADNLAMIREGQRMDQLAAVSQ